MAQCTFVFPTVRIFYCLCVRTSLILDKRVADIQNTEFTACTCIKQKRERKMEGASLYFPIEEQRIPSSNMKGIPSNASIYVQI